MTERRDHYQTLGVDRSASTEQIKRAYRKLAKQHHPDRNPGNPDAEAKFKEVQQAYDTLSDSSKRAQYDQFGEAGVGQFHTSGSGERMYQWGGGSSINIDDLEDLVGAFGGGERASIFEQLFGGGQTRRAIPRRGADEEHAVSLSFDQAVHGTTVNVHVRSPHDGRSERLEVKIPPGVESGQKIRLKGKGQPGPNGGPSGDLHLICSVAPHKFFERDGADIQVEVPITLVEAALGAKIDVPSIEGPVTITIPPGTAGGSRLRLKGRGLARPNGSGRGDQYVAVKLVPPTQITDDQRKLLEQLRETFSEDPRASCSWW